jgi:hypothetical protein
MAKQSGLGDNFYIAGFDLSGDISSVDQMSAPLGLLDVTGIKKFGHEQIGAQRNADWQFTSFFEFGGTSNPIFEHDALSGLPRGDVVGTYFRGTTLQNPAACINAKQVSYDPTRDNSGNLTIKVELAANSFGMEWGEMLTAGLRTDSAATAGSFIDDGAASSFGGQAYFQLVAFTGTSVTIDIQSATTSGGTYATTGLTSSALAAKGAQRVAIANTVTINRYLKVVTTGTFSNAVFAVAFMRNPIAGIVF